jgi:hypothetical protein
MAAASMSRALHRELEVTDAAGEPAGLLVAARASSFWREHSGRHNMPSWVAALLEVPEEWISHLGGWAVSGTAIRYIGTVEKRIVKMQGQVAVQLRAAKGKADAIDEEGLLIALGGHMKDMGCDDEGVANQIKKLTWHGSADTADLLFDEIASEDDGFGVATDGFEKIEEPEDVVEEKNTEDLSIPSVRADMRKSLPAEFLGKFAVSISSKTSRRCLHLLGACHRIPGLHYSEFRIFDERPAEEEYHAHCLQCWRKSVELPAESESDGSSSTEAEL